MKTLHEIFESGGQSSAPYNTALKVVVCGIGQVVQYRNASGDQRESVTVGFADQSNFSFINKLSLYLKKKILVLGRNGENC